MVWTSHFLLCAHYDVRVHTWLEYYVPLYASATAGEELFAIQFAYLTVTSKLSFQQTAFDWKSSDKQ